MMQVQEQISGMAKISFGIVLIAEITIILFLLLHLITLTRAKLNRIIHEHVTWRGGQIFLAYLGLVFIFNLLNGVSVYYGYLVSEEPFTLLNVALRVSAQTLLLFAKICLWYYTTHHEFNLFKDEADK